MSVRVATGWAILALLGAAFVTVMAIDIGWLGALIVVALVSILSGLGILAAWLIGDAP